MNNYVLVTGGAKGLGLAISSSLLSSGYSVVAASRSSSPEFQNLVSRHAGCCEFRPLDLKQPAGLYSWSRALMQEHGTPYGLVNNSGVGYDGVLGTMHESQIVEALTINLTSPIILTKYLSRRMLSRKTGRIINISSIIASTGFSGLSVYGATKAGLVGFTKSLARELGKYGITVNAVAPGYLQTEMTNGLQGAKLEAIIRRSPLGRLAGVEDVASLVTYLMSPDAKSITGSVLTVDAGSTS